MTNQERASLGGKAVVKKYGSSYMSELGKKGAEATWNKYYIAPIGTRGLAMVDRETEQIVAWIVQL